MDLLGSVLHTCLLNLCLCIFLHIWVPHRNMFPTVIDVRPTQSCKLLLRNWLQVCFIVFLDSPERHLCRGSSEHHNGYFELPYNRLVGFGGTLYYFIHVDRNLPLSSSQTGLAENQSWASRRSVYCPTI